MTNPDNKPHSELKSFSFAFRGIAFLFSSQKHFRFHLAAALGALLAAFFLNISRMEWGLLVLAMCAVLTSEALNTALEFALDAVSPGYHPLVEKAKDTAAGAVLISAAGSVIIGVLIFGPRLLAFFS